eukprot:3471453-Prorocentrum_lima.AAC.1
MNPGYRLYGSDCLRPKQFSMMTSTSSCTTVSGPPATESSPVCLNSVEEQQKCQCCRSDERHCKVGPKFDAVGG